VIISNQHNKIVLAHGFLIYHFMTVYTHGVTVCLHYAVWKFFKKITDICS